MSELISTRVDKRTKTAVAYIFAGLLAVTGAKVSWDFLQRADDIADEHSREYLAGATVESITGRRILAVHESSLDTDGRVTALVVTDVLMCGVTYEVNPADRSAIVNLDVTNCR